MVTMTCVHACMVSRISRNGIKMLRTSRLVSGVAYSTFRCVWGVSGQRQTHIILDQFVNSYINAVSELCYFRLYL